MKHTLLLFLFLPWVCLGQEMNLNVNNIPDSLKENADAVIRYEEKKYSVKDIDKIKLEGKKVVTVLNDDGRKHGNLKLHFDNDIKIRSISGDIYNSHGEKEENIRRGDFYEESNFQYFTLYSDSKIEYNEVVYPETPYTVVYEYKKIYKSFIGIRWVPIRSEDIALQKAKLLLEAPSDYNFNSKFSKEYNADTLFSGGDRTYQWKINHQKPIIDKEYDPPLLSYWPHLMITPHKFEYDDYEGYSDSWESFGKWLYDLTENKNKLSPSTKREIREITSGAESDKEKVKIIYNYMQDKMRYVSIQLGIGGYIPTNAKKVDKNAYGDCKALSNYTKSLLEVVGINSYNTIIGSGKNHRIMYPEFANAMQANHQILMVPMKNDTIWLECTNSFFPYDHIGIDNAGRYALQLTKEGGKIVKTPAYNYKRNHLKTIVNAEITPSGKLKATSDYTAFGSNISFLSALNNFSEVKQKERLREQLFDQHNLTIKGHTYSAHHNSQPYYRLNIELVENDFGTAGNNRIVFDPFYFNNFKKNIGEDFTRNIPIYIYKGFKDEDSIQYNLPEGYKNEFLPKTANIQSEFGEYKLDFKPGEESLLMTRSIVIYDGEYKANKYDALKSFFDKIRRIENQKVILKANKPVAEKQ